jgi:rhamnosyltransferase
VISILIRTRNEAAWLGRTLEAVRGQDASDIEVLVVDSGSEDDTLLVARRYPVRILEIPRETFSYGHALNIGAEAARGECIVSLSAHAVPADRFWLSRLRQPLENRSVAGASSRHRAHPGERVDGHRAFWQGLHSLGLRTPATERYLFSNAASILRGDLARRYRFDEDLGHCEDHQWALQMQNLGYRIGYVPDSVVLHSHGHSLGERARRSRKGLLALSEIYGWIGSGPRTRTSGSRQLRAAALLMRYNRFEARRARAGDRRRTTKGAVYDLYEPKARRPRTVVLIYGLTLEGELDPRVVAFAQALRGSGVRAVVPVLPGLKSFRFLAEDLTAVEDLLTTLQDEHGGPVAVAAFSTGAALALAAASRADLREHVDPILLFGPACDLELLWEGFRETCRRSPVTAKEWDHAIYVHAALAFRCREQLGLSQEDAGALVNLLDSYCRQPSLDEKKSFYERVLRGRESQALEMQSLEHEAVDRLYSMENIHLVDSRVLMIHDPFDHVVPAQHAKEVFRALRSREVSRGERMVLTSFLAHASARRGWGLRDVPSGLAALDLIGELLE